MIIKAIASCRGMRHSDHRRTICRPAGGNVHSELTIFTGNANPSLAATIARELNAQLGSCVIDRYPDGDVAVQLLDSVRRKEVFLVQPTSPPVNDHLVELLALADACRRAGASSNRALLRLWTGR
jgi:phosphoribosylpyrophosphate synthetase